MTRGDDYELYDFFDYSLFLDLIIHTCTFEDRNPSYSYYSVFPTLVFSDMRPLSWFSGSANICTRLRERSLIFFVCSSVKCLHPSKNTYSGNSDNFLSVALSILHTSNSLTENETHSIDSMDAMWQHTLKKYAL